MLTQNDLQAIGKIFENKLGPLEARMGRLETRMDHLEARMGRLETRMDLLERKLSALDKKTNQGFKSVDTKLNMIINYFDLQDVGIRKRLNRIEAHLGLAPLNS